MKISACILLAVTLFANSLTGLASETDQYDLPPTPLFDIGDEVSDHVEENLRLAVNKVNADIAVHQACVDNTGAKGTKCGSAGSELKKLAALRTNDAVALEVFKRLGFGSIILSNIGKWFNRHQFSNEPALYKTAYTDSIYLFSPINYATLGPTVKLYGIELGTDKIEHLFQQGYDYYKIYSNAIAKGQTPDQATAKAVKWGQMTERTYFGLLISGVYSNADLCANYDGLKFYQGLTQPVQIGAATRPATLVLKNGKWKIHEDADLKTTLLKPFLTEHLNEALNPSGYSFLLYPSVRDIVRKKSCPQWRTKYPDLTPAEINARSAALTLWNGENYGYTKKYQMVTIADNCFDKLAPI